ncbi:hypothetical protein V3C99_016734 [Haemonchus contortus]
MLRAFHVELFVHGNATEQEALTLGHAVTKTLREASKSRPLFRNEFTPCREHALENGDAYVYRHFQNTHEMSCVKVLFQAGIQTSRGSALVELLAQLLREPAFNQLRTVEQLVDSSVEVLKTVTKEDLLSYFDLKFTRNAPERRMIAVFVHGKGEQRDGMVEESRAKREIAGKVKLEEVECMEQFRESLSLYARPRPKMNLPPIGAEPLSSLAPGDAKSKYCEVMNNISL